MAIPTSPRLRWYQSTVGILLFAVGVVIVAVAIFLLALSVRYYREIKEGRGEALFEKVYGGFTGDVNSVGGIAERNAIETADDPFLGNVAADVVVVEFVDLKCPNCLAALPIMKQVLQKYGHKFKFIIRDFPVESTHPGAGQLAEIANCASEQGLYWVAYDWFFAHQSELSGVLSADEIKKVVDKINLGSNAGLNYEKLTTCLHQSAIKIEINRDYVGGYNAGVRGTPTFFINGEKVEGVIPFAVWDKYFQNK